MSPAVLDLADDDGQHRGLTVEDVLAVARGLHPVALLNEDPGRFRPLEAHMDRSVAWVDRQLQAIDHPSAEPVYGINTGFGALAGRETFRTVALAKTLSRNLLVSHSSGAGPCLPEDVVRATMLIRANQLARGYSGIRIPVVNRLLAMLNARVYPCVPEMGSLGASGDLAPLAHLAILLSKPPDTGSEGIVDAPTGESATADISTGHAWLQLENTSIPGPEPNTDLDPDARHVDPNALHITHHHLTGRAELWRRVTGIEAMVSVGGQIELTAKEGLALTNGATVSTALAALAVADAECILSHAELAVAMTLEAIRGFRDPFLDEVQIVRGFSGAASVARQVLGYVAGSTLLDPAAVDANPQRVPPQDPYSVRCAPQVLGAARDAVAFIRSTVETELNAAVDNPLIFLDLPRSYKAVSGGNFHGAPIGYAMDLLKVVITDCGSMSERRTFKLTDYRFEDAARAHLSLPRFLTTSPPGLEGMNSGMMIAQYTAASLVSAAKTLAHPDSVDSIPSSANQEDHVSMSMNAGLHAAHVIRHVESVVAIELLTAAQALEFRRPQGTPGHGIAAAVERLRRDVPALTHDRPLAPDIERVVYLMRSGELIEAARAV